SRFQGFQIDNLIWDFGIFGIWNFWNYSLPPLVPEERYKSKIIELFLDQLSVYFPDPQHNLLLAVAYRYDENAAFGKLVGKRLGHDGSACGHNDFVERGFGGQAFGAVAMKKV